MSYPGATPHRVSPSDEPESGTSLSSHTRGAEQTAALGGAAAAQPTSGERRPQPANDVLPVPAEAERSSEAPSAPIVEGSVRLVGLVERHLRVVGLDQHGPQCEPYFTLRLSSALEVPAAPWDAEERTLQRVRSVELTTDPKQRAALEGLVGEEARVIGSLGRLHDQYTNVSLVVERVRAESSWLKALG